jgi:4a-hydroxytetrahydrobiopterin dehydratase
MPDVLSAEEVKRQLPDGWEYGNGEISRTFEFEDYLDGVVFASTVGEVAEEEFHHPEIVIGYEEVEVHFRTHEAEGVTEKDIRLAGLVNDEF